MLYGSDKACSIQVQRKTQRALEVEIELDNDFSYNTGWGIGALGIVDATSDRQ